MQVIVLFTKIISLFCSLVMLLTATDIADISVNASGCVVIDADTKTVLYDHNMHSQLPVASTTKIMTCLIACDSGKLNKTVTISQQMIADTEGTLLYLHIGDKITLLDLVKASLLASANDAAKSIAVFLEGTEKKFCAIMNRKANELGMKNTEFYSASGLDIGNHHSSAYDMAILASVALGNKCFADICKKQSDYISINGNRQKIYNHNKLLSFDSSFVGVKTGFTSKAGRCLVSAYDYKGNTIIIVTLNDADDWNTHKKLVEYAKEKYNVLAEYYDYKVQIVGSDVDYISTDCNIDVCTLGKVRVVSNIYPFQYAPVVAGQEVGKLIVFCNNTIIKAVPITAREGAEYCG